MSVERDVESTEVQEVSVELDDAGDTDSVTVDSESSEEVDDTVETVVAKPEPKTYKAGNIPDGQLDATRLYLSEIGISKLLTAEEEVYFSRLAQ